MKFIFISLGLSEWGEAVVEFANHSLESVTVFCTVVEDVVEGIFVEPLLLLPLPVRLPSVVLSSKI
ncbi:hypothetical protein Bhyg_16295 [Pseudolycoriella hygida]|uniref:Uncharacterized protein n=1 Tax=Pseudolycoriella hygida TaxID=35572 RepID=A0A9Q0RV27_9DIPT|nr:hypothetical protein Bhyg_16295 [Pseudolycoriella hygida]